MAKSKKPVNKKCSFCGCVGIHTNDCKKPKSKKPDKVEGPKGSDAGKDPKKLSNNSDSKNTPAA